MNEIGEVARIVVISAIPINLAFLLFGGEIENKVLRKLLWYSGVIPAIVGFIVLLFSTELMQLWEAINVKY